MAPQRACASFIPSAPTTMHVILSLLTLFTYQTTHLYATRFALHRKQQLDSTPTRRRLSFLMDSFVDPSISDDYFYAVMFVGSPHSQRVEMALDTGSGLPYFACKETCTHCGKHDDLPFIITNSSTFQWVPCGHALCGGGRCKKMSGNSVCEWTQRYVDKSAISAAVGSDVISFYKYPYLPLSDYRESFRQIKRTAKSHINAELKMMANELNETQPSSSSSLGRPALRPPLEMERKLRLVFGCSESEANTIFRQGADGVMGLSMHHRSFVDQLFDSNRDRNRMELGSKHFAHCFGATTGGLLMFGSVEIQELVNRFQVKPVWINLLSGGNGHGWYRVKTVGFDVQYSSSTLEAMEQAMNSLDSLNAMKTLNGNSNGTESVNDIDITFDLKARSDPIRVQYTSSLNSGYHGSVLDTGSSTLSMPRRPSKEIMSGILKLVNGKMGNGSVPLFKWIADRSKNYDYFLQIGGRSLFSKEEFDKMHSRFIRFFPDVIMYWNGDGAKANKEPLRFTVPVERYLLFKSNRICLDLFGDTPSLLIGSNVMVNKLMIYDREQMKVGVADIDCDSLLIDHGQKEEEDKEQKEEKEEEEKEKEDNDETVTPLDPLSPFQPPPPQKEEKKTPSPTTKANGGRPPIESPVVFIHLENHKMYGLYFVMVIVLALCIGCIHRMVQNRGNHNTRSKGRYERVNREEPDDDEEGDEMTNRIDMVPNGTYHRQNGHRRRRRMQSEETMDRDHGPLSAVNTAMNLDFASMTTPTQSFAASRKASAPRRSHEPELSAMDELDAL